MWGVTSFQIGSRATLIRDSTIERGELAGTKPEARVDDRGVPIALIGDTEPEEVIISTNIEKIRGKYILG